MTDALLGAAVALVVLWLLLLVMLWLAKPDETTLRQMLRLLPDVIRLVRSLASDPQVARPVRLRLFLLLAYLTSPIDLVPDVIPVLGYADDVIIVALVLRSVLRITPPGVLQRHWPGTPEGLAAVRTLVRA